jgi:penicillin-binding protein 1A
MRLALADKPAVPFRVPKGISFLPIDQHTGLRAQPGTPGSIMEAFKPGTSPPDSYSIIGFTDAMGRPMTIIPDGRRTATSGTGGLY